MLNLHPDILYYLLPQCDSATLFAAMQVAKFVRGRAEKLLYRSIQLDSTRRCRDLIAAIDDMPERGNLVRDLFIQGVEDRDLFAELLGRLPQLKRLDVTLSCEFPANGFDFRLQHLRIHDLSETLDSTDFVAFLDQQDELEVLQLVGSDSNPRWPWLRACARDQTFGKLLPRLRALQAPLDMILAFLSNARPELRDIMVQTTVADVAPAASQNGEVAQELCAAIERSAVNLHSLTLGTLDAAATIRLVAGACAHLHSLQLMVHHRETFSKFVAESQADELHTTPVSPVKHFALHVVHEDPLEPVDLCSAFQTKVMPGLRHILPGLDECQLMLHREPDILVPEE